MNPVKKAAISFIASLVIAGAFFARAHAASYYYDPQGHLIEIVFSSGTTWIKYTYDDNGNRTSAVYGPSGTLPSDASAGLASSLWQSATYLGSGWMNLPWFGDFYVDNATGWIYHQQLGWLLPSGPSLADLTFWDPNMNALWWTSSTQFPDVYRFSDGVWLQYQEWSADPRLFYNLTTDTMESWPGP